VKKKENYKGTPDMHSEEDKKEKIIETIKKAIE
jgi:hypothetical protein